MEALIARRARHTMNVLQIQVGSPGAKTHSDGHATLDADYSRFGPHACEAESIHDRGVNVGHRVLLCVQ